MRIMDWRSSVCSSDLAPLEKLGTEISLGARRRSLDKANPDEEPGVRFLDDLELACATRAQLLVSDEKLSIPPTECRSIDDVRERSEEHTSELQSLMRTSYAIFCLKKKHQ